VDESLYLYRELPNSQCREPAKERMSIRLWAKSKENAQRRRQQVLFNLLGPDAEISVEDLMMREGEATGPAKFSIVLTNYNHAEYIGGAIKSVLNQSFKEWELIIVDDCSTDDSPKKIQPYLADKRIRLIRHEKNAGYTAALKTGIANVQTEYFGILDSDDCLAFNAVEVMYNEHVENPECGFMYSKKQHCDKNLLPIRVGTNKAVLPGKSSIDCDTISQFKTFKLTDYLKTEGYDEDILYAEDKDIIYKMEEVAKLRFVDKVLYLARELPDSHCHGDINLTIGMMARAKAKINACRRRCATVAKRDNINDDHLFRQSLLAMASVHNRDVGRYLEFLGTALQQGAVRCEDMPVKITDNNIVKYTMRLAANVKFRDIRKIMDLIEESEKPLISVYMVTYNTEKYIGRAIDSVLAQTYRSLELIIVDDGSTDSTASIVSSYNDPRIKYVYKEHKNFAAGMNRAITKAGGDYIIGVDSDDFIAPDYIKKMVACAVKNPDADYLYPAKLVLTDEFDSPTGAVWEYMDFPDSSILPAFLFANGYGPIPNPGSLKKKELFQKAMYPEIDTVEDFDFLCKNAWKIKFKRVDDSSVYFYRRLASSNSNKFKARNELMARTLNDMLSVYPAHVLCPQLDQIQEPMAKQQYFLKYLVDTFYRLSSGNMVKFPQYYRQYGDHYKAMLLQQAGKTPAIAFSAVADSGKQTAADLFRQGSGYLKSSQPALALDCFDRAAGTGAKIANLHYGRAIALAQLGKIDKARQECQTELQIQPGNAQAKNLLMKICN
jgi:glycosyltransferase involved in cell wall biosynthesis